MSAGTSSLSLAYHGHSIRGFQTGGLHGSRVVAHNLKASELKAPTAFEWAKRHREARIQPLRSSVPTPAKQVRFLCT